MQDLFNPEGKKVGFNTHNGFSKWGDRIEIEGVYEDAFVSIFIGNDCYGRYPIHLVFDVFGVNNKNREDWIKSAWSRIDEMMRNKETRNLSRWNDYVHCINTGHTVGEDTEIMINDGHPLGDRRLLPFSGPQVHHWGEHILNNTDCATGNQFEEE